MWLLMSLLTRPLSPTIRAVSTTLVSPPLNKMYLPYTYPLLILQNEEANFGRPKSAVSVEKLLTTRMHNDGLNHDHDELGCTY